MGDQVWDGVVGVPHRRHKEGHHSTGEDDNNDDIEDDDVEYGDSNGGADGEDHANDDVECYSPPVKQNVQYFILKVIRLCCDFCDKSASVLNRRDHIKRGKFLRKKIGGVPDL